MNNRIDLYIYNANEDFRLAELYRITNGVKAETYTKGKWEICNNVFSYYPDPSPAQYVELEEAQIIMEKMDKRDNVTG